MAFAAEFSDWYCCLHPHEKGMVGDCVLYVDRVTMSMVQGIFDGLQLVHFGLDGDDRAQAFNGTFSILEHVPTGLPPPLDELAVFLGSTWTPIFDAFDAGENSCDTPCDFSDFDVEYNGLGRPVGT